MISESLRKRAAKARALREAGIFKRMPLTAAEHARRLDLLLKGKEEGLTIEAIATRGGMYGGSFYNWVKRYHPEHLPPPRKKTEPPPALQLPPSKMLPTHVTAERARIWVEGSARGDTWAAMARKAGVTREAWKEWVYRNVPGASELRGEPCQSIQRLLARDLSPREAPRPKKRRPCITCSDPFDSEGPGHRMCGECRSRAASSSPYEPDYGRSARQMPARRA